MLYVYKLYTWPDEANKVNRVYKLVIMTQTTVWRSIYTLHLYAPYIRSIYTLHIHAPSIRCVVRRINDQQHLGAIIGGSGYKRERWTIIVRELHLPGTRRAHRSKNVVCYRYPSRPLRRRLDARPEINPSARADPRISHLNYTAIYPAPGRAYVGLDNGGRRAHDDTHAGRVLIFQRPVFLPSR